ncbi:hypothetical protein KVR01_012240 [Diaporthe batatas]|uniref:uncharacterized protein n=1 Tax=Diaporthe batatas TaxID=748121 RepID=UPI001D055A68|nr:uncharacterized protein KVR01_012240 [Diaporthe batatas]KAG8157968.1 hypothetical protein KVR01_012240 [Diaporthe batatas]
MLFLNEFITSHFRADRSFDKQRMASVRENMLQLVHKYLSVMNEQGPDGLRTVMAPDFRLKIAPKTLGLPPPGSLDAYIDLLKGSQKAMGSKNSKMFLVDGFEPVVDEAGHRVVLHLQSTADSNFGPVENEFMVILKTTEDGTKIKEQHEFMDSAAFAALMGKMQGQQA